MPNMIRLSAKPGCRCLGPYLPDPASSTRGHLVSMYYVGPSQQASEMVSYQKDNSLKIAKCNVNNLKEINLVQIMAILYSCQSFIVRCMDLSSSAIVNKHAPAWFFLPRAPNTSSVHKRHLVVLWNAMKERLSIKIHTDIASLEGG